MLQQHRKLIHRCCTFWLDLFLHVLSFSVILKNIVSSFTFLNGNVSIYYSYFYKLTEWQSPSLNIFRNLNNFWLSRKSKCLKLNIMCPFYSHFFVSLCLGAIYWFFLFHSLAKITCTILILIISDSNSSPHDISNLSIFDGLDFLIHY